MLLILVATIVSTAQPDGLAQEKWYSSIDVS